MNIADSVINWYNINKRDLPWRKNKDAYSIWVSEIIMQQTRIIQGLPYYVNFLKHFPSVNALAEAPEEKVLLLWQGLGYYSRARNMHFTAKDIVKKHEGIFPSCAKELIKLKGIGTYTAAAISSFCHDENIPAIDGNVIRVISRLFNIVEPVNKNATLKQIEDISRELIHKKNASDYNQGMMDLGATICLPKNPTCHTCPLKTVCLANKQGSQHKIPLKEKSAKPKDRFLSYLVFKTAQHTLIQKRSSNDIWKGLFEFPVLEFTKPTPFEEALKSPEIIEIMSNGNFTFSRNLTVAPHKLSHQTIKANFIILEPNKLPIIANTRHIEIKNLYLHAFPRLIEKHLEDIFS